MEYEQQRSMWDHVVELRTTALQLIVVWVISSALTVWFQAPIFDTLLAPLGGQKLNFLSPGDPITFLIKIHLFLGFVTSFPILLWIVWKYVAEVFSDAHRGFITTVIPAGLIFAYLGIVYGYFFLIPQSVEILTSIQPEGTQFQLTAQAYIDFVFGLLLIIMAIFQVPLIIYSTIKAKLIKAQFYAQRRREFYMGFLVATAIFTPTPDAFTLLLIVVPMIVMYEVALLLGRI